MNEYEGLKAKIENLKFAKDRKNSQMADKAHVAETPSTATF
jgi:hypothetical protein